jgi:gluconate 2-dehydrogenase gamma chain
MSEQTRREVFRGIAAAMLIGTLLPAQQAEHIHHAVADAKVGGNYQPKALTPHEYSTLQDLSEIIIPGSSEAGAPAFIDFLCSVCDDMKDIFTGGIGWLDEQMGHRYQVAGFLDAKPEQQTEMLDLIAYRKNASPELNPGIHFFDWARRMVVDGYYTSPAGFKEVGYMGNQALSHFSVPQEPLDYALKRSPV